MKQKVKICEIKWIDKEIKEASVLFEINGFTLEAFCHPCSFNEGEVILAEFDYIEEEIPLDAIFNNNQSQLKDFVHKGQENWGYEIYGQVKSINPIRIDCGYFDFEIIMKMDDESIIGSYINYPINRLDIFKA